MFNTIKIDCFNYILNSNQGTKIELQPYAGRTFNINVMGICLSSKIKSDGSFDYYKESNNHDVEILIPMAATSYLIHKDQLATFKQLTINGDQAFGRKLLEILAKIHLTGFYPKSPVFGVIILQIEKIITLIKEQILLTTRNGSQSISEYLLYETNDIVSRYEIETFCHNVDTLQEQTELLEQKINRLMNTK